MELNWVFLAAAVVCVTTVSEGGGLSIVSPSILNKKNSKMSDYIYTFTLSRERKHVSTHVRAGLRWEKRVK